MQSNTSSNMRRISLDRPKSGPDNADVPSPPGSPGPDIGRSFVPSELAHLQSIKGPAPTNLFQSIMNPEAGTLDRITSNKERPWPVASSLTYDPLNCVQSPRDRKTPNLLKAPSFPRVYGEIPPLSPFTSRSSTPDPTAVKDFASHGVPRIYENLETESNISIDQRALSPDGTVASSFLSRPELEAGRSTPVSTDKTKSVRRQQSFSTLRIGPYPGLAGVEYDPEGRVRDIPAREDSHHTPSFQADPREADSSGNASDDSLGRPSRFEERLELDGVALYSEDDGSVVQDRSLFMRLRLYASKSKRNSRGVQRARDVDGNGTTITVTELDATNETKKKSGIRGRLGEWWKKLKERFEKKKETQ